MVHHFRVEFAAAEPESTGNAIIAGELLAIPASIGATVAGDVCCTVVVAGGGDCEFVETVSDAKLRRQLNRKQRAIEPP